MCCCPPDQARLRGLGMGFFILCVVLYIYVGYGSCKSYLQVFRTLTNARALSCCTASDCTFLVAVVPADAFLVPCVQSWLGFLPMNIVMAGASHLQAANHCLHLVCLLLDRCLQLDILWSATPSAEAHIPPAARLRVVLPVDAKQPQVGQGRHDSLAPGACCALPFTYCLPEHTVSCMASSRNIAPGPGSVRHSIVKQLSHVLQACP